MKQPPRLRRKRGRRAKKFEKTTQKKCWGKISKELKSVIPPRPKKSQTKGKTEKKLREQHQKAERKSHQGVSKPKLTRDLKKKKTGTILKGTSKTKKGDQRELVTPKQNWAKRKNQTHGHTRKRTGKIAVSKPWRLGGKKRKKENWAGTNEQKKNPQKNKRGDVSPGKKGKTSKEKKAGEVPEKVKEAGARAEESEQGF